jgi:hypothetical protein
MFAKHPWTKEIVFFKDSFIVDENNKDENFSYLINYFTLSIIAQSFEAFESFIKDIYRRNLSLNIKNEAVLKIATKNVRSLKNAEVLKVLQSICPTLSQIFDDDNMSWLRKMELIRHCIVHNDQTIEPVTIKEVKNRFIDCHFIFKPIPNSERSRIFVAPDVTTIILDAFQGLSFSTFILMSETEKFPVAMVETNESKKKP